MTQGTTDGDDSLVTFMIQLPSGGPYGPFFYQLTAIEDNVTLAVVQGQQYTGKIKYMYVLCVTKMHPIGNIES